jgi:hypothetical protein
MTAIFIAVLLTATLGLYALYWSLARRRCRKYGHKWREDVFGWRCRRCWSIFNMEE